MKNTVFFLLILFTLQTTLFSQTNKSYDLWLQYNKIDNKNLEKEYSNIFNNILFNANSETLEVAKKELNIAINKMLNKKVVYGNSKNSLIISSKENLPKNTTKYVDEDLSKLPKNGFIIKQIKNKKHTSLIITANDDLGILYGVFRFLRWIQNQNSFENISLIDFPKTDIRILNHWDNLDGTVERGYAGKSIWNWHKLPEFIDQRYIDYARANASIGINGVALTNVNANALILTPAYIEKVKALATVFKPYGIKVYLTARFSAPIEIGFLETADPLNKKVQEWWNTKVAEIYESIPNFGGFLVKANSEGQPGPQNYGRNHVDGANMLAKALAPYNGIVMWRAFVYSEHDTTDRAKQAYSEFVPYDGKFENNVLIQVKNGAIDFQPREPFHPMFGAMPKTPLMMEFQITQEYLGFSTHLVFLPKLYEEVLQSDTFAEGKGSTVSKIISGKLQGNKISGVAGVSNIGSDINWTGHLFGQANWYGFGRLAWNPDITADEIADEWLRATFSNDEKFVSIIKKMMLESREAAVNYMTPLGLHHLMDTGHHYGPGPWVGNLPRPEWNPVYYHKADSLGIGFDRSKTGSNATAQYSKEIEKIFDNPKTCPEELLLWFHHLPWDYKLKNGKTLWVNLAEKYQQGVDEVKQMAKDWKMAKNYVDEERYKEVSMSLSIQLKEAKWWKDASMLYFQTFSKREFPSTMEKPTQTLEYYKSLKFPFAPGIKPSWD